MSEKQETSLKLIISLKSGRIYEKWDSASLTNEEAGKKMTLDISSSSRPDSNAKQGDGSEEAASVPTSSVMDDNLSPILMEDKPRDKHNTDSSSLNIHDQHPQTENMGSPSSLRASPSSRREEQSPGLIDDESSERKLIYTKKLTYSNIYYGRMMIPVECVAVLFPGLKRRIILLVVDSRRQLWDMEALLDELSYYYMLRANCNAFVNEHDLRPG